MLGVTLWRSPLKIFFISTASLLGLFLAAPADQKGHPGTTLSGKVTDVTGADVPNALVTVISPERVIQNKTDSNGKFEFVDLGAGTYDLEISAPGFMRKLIEALEIKGKAAKPLEVSLNVGSTGENCIRRPESSYEETTSEKASLVGKVRDYESATPIAQAQLALSKAGETETLATQLSNKAGEFKFVDLEPGKYFLKATREGYQEVAEIKLWVTRENRTRLAIEMYEKGRMYVCA